MFLYLALIRPKFWNLCILLHMKTVLKNTFKGILSIKYEINKTYLFQLFV